MGQIDPHTFSFSLITRPRGSGRTSFRQMKRYLTLFALLWSTIILMAETWTNVGTGKWYDSIVDTWRISDDYPVYKSWNVQIEQSDERPNVFRVQPYARASETLGKAEAYGSQTYNDDNVYVYIHVVGRNRVYIEGFRYMYFGNNGYTSSKYYLTVTQRCPENSFDCAHYGDVYSTTETDCLDFYSDSFEVTRQIGTSETKVTRYNRSWVSLDFPKGILSENIYDKDPTEYSDIWVRGGLYIIKWHDVITKTNLISTSYPVKDKVISFPFEQSSTKPNVFRFQPYTQASETLGKAEAYGSQTYNDDNVYVYLHAKAKDKIYLEPYTWFYFGDNGYTSNKYNLTVKQRCPENGYSSKYYGKLSDDGRTIIFPIGAFETSGGYSGKTTYTTEVFKLVFPSGVLNDDVFNFVEPDPEDDSGIYMGVTSFNTTLKTLPIQRLSDTTKNTFFDFINGLQMDNATLLYYAVEKSIDALGNPTYPDNLSNAILVTFTDGLDQGSLAMNPTPKNWRNYAAQLHTKIGNTKIQELPLKAYTIGLKSADVLDDEQFMFNLTQLASDDSNAHSVANIAEVENELTKIYKELNSRTTKRTISITVPMMSDGDKYRLTLDGTNASSSAKESKRWIQGTFSIDDYSLNNIEYYGISSTSGTKVKGSLNGLYLTFTFDDCRDETGNILDIKDEDIDEWIYIPSRDDWQHNVEMMREGVIKVEDIKTSAAIMFALDASKSLGDQFPALKTTATNFIQRLLGQYSAVEDIRVEAVEEPQDWSDAEVYNLQGIRVTNPTSGFYILRKGNYTKKILLR